MGSGRFSEESAESYLELAISLCDMLKSFILVSALEYLSCSFWKRSFLIFFFFLFNWISTRFLIWWARVLSLSAYLLRLVWSSFLFLIACSVSSDSSAANEEGCPSSRRATVCCSLWNLALNAVCKFSLIDGSSAIFFNTYYKSKPIAAISDGVKKRLTAF